MTPASDRRLSNVVKKIMYVIIVLALIAGGWLLYQHYHNIGRSDSNAINSTIQSAESDNQSARSDIGSAAGEIADAQSKLDSAAADIDDAQQSVSSLQTDNSDDQAVIDQCNDLVASSRSNLAAAREILGNAADSGQGTGTSCSSTAAST